MFKPVQSAIDFFIMYASTRLRIHFSILLLFFIVKATAQPKCKIERYSTEDGLSHDAVTCMMKDRDGFMWFGTWDGINRFDGHNFISYKSSPGDQSQLKNDRIDQIVEDRSNHLWLRAYDKEIYRFDKKTEQFLPISPFINTTGKQKIDCSRIIAGENGSIWLVTFRNGLLFIPQTNLSSPRFISYKKGLKPGYQLPSNTINFFHQDHDHNIWIGTPDGACLLTKSASGAYQSIPLEVNLAANLNFTTVNEDDHQLYFGTSQGYLIIYNKTSKKTICQKITSNTLNALILSKINGCIYGTTSAGELIKVNLNDNNITTSVFTRAGGLYSIYEDRGGKLWIEPKSQGVVRFDPYKRSFQYFSQKNDALYNNSGNHFKVLEDNSGLILINMKGGGFGYYNEAKAKVDYFYDDPDDPNRQLSNIVTCLYYDTAGILWLSTDDRGIDKIIFQNTAFNQQQLVDQAPFKSDNEVRGILYDRKGRLWLGVKSGKLYIYQNNKRINIQFINEPPGGLGLVYSMLQDRLGNIWLGTKASGLYKASPINTEETTYRLTNYQADKQGPNSLNSNEIYALQEDHEGRIWIGTFDEGLNLAVNDHNTVKFSHTGAAFKHYPKEAFRKIRNMALDREGNLWIGTTDGLLVVDPVSGHSPAYRYVSYRKIPGSKQSLGNNDIQFIYRDSKNTMWLATSGGGLDQAIGDDPFQYLTFKDYSTRDGLPNDYVLSCAEDNHRNLWIATQNGLSKFNIAKKQFRNYDSYDGLPKTGFSEASCIRTAGGDIVFGNIKGFLTFNPDRITNYRFKANMALTNLQINNEDIAPGDNDAVNYNIDYIKKLKLKYNQNIISIDYAVLDYRSSFKQAYAYRLTGFDTVWHNNKGQRRATYTNLPPGNYTFEVKSLSNDLYTKLPAKSLAITILPPPWRTWWAYLIYLLLAVIAIETIRRIALTMLKLRHRIAVEKRLSDLKLSFFTNVSHELRTPLTLILNPIEEIARKEELSKQGNEYINVVRKNANRMVRFINQLLDLRKVQSGKATLTITQTEMVAFIRNIGEYFTDIAREKRIELKISANTDELWAYIDADKIDIVIYNILANAFKFTPEGKTICIILNQFDADDYFRIEIIDQGIGVANDKLNDIFELYYEGDNRQGNHQKGTGIGLALSKEFIELHQGKIVAKNNPEGGLTIAIELKLENDYFTGDQGALTHLGEASQQIQEIEESLYSLTLSVTRQNDINVPLVLLVEDNIDLRKFLVIQLSEFYRVEEAENGEEGLQKAVQLLPDLILSDVMMPKMTGIQMLDQLKNDLSTSHIPVVLLSAKFSVESQIEGLKYGADCYITKPFRNDYLFMSIENLLRQRKKIFESFLNGKKTINLGPGEIMITSKDEIFLKEVIKIVEDGMLDTEFNIDTVAETIAMSRSAFYKKFKSLTDLAPVEFVREMRLKRARQYFDAGDHNIAEIAYAVGFNNAKYFSTCFKEQYHLTPSEYLKSRASEVH